MSSNSKNNTTTLAENKVLILYILNLIDNDIRQDALFKIITSINNINYFYFNQIMADLIDSKLVGKYTKEEEQVIKITSEGKNAYILTKDVLPGLMKLKADNIFKKEFASIEEESSVSSEFIPKNENDYTIKCKIIENNETIFEVKTFAGSRERAKRIVDNWNKNAKEIYPKILNLLLREQKRTFLRPQLNLRSFIYITSFIASPIILLTSAIKILNFVSASKKLFASLFSINSAYRFCIFLYFSSSFFPVCIISICTSYLIFSKSTNFSFNGIFKFTVSFAIL